MYMLIATLSAALPDSTRASWHPVPLLSVLEQGCLKDSPDCCHAHPNLDFPKHAWGAYGVHVVLKRAYQGSWSFKRQLPS